MFRSNILRTQSLYGKFSKKYFSNFDYDVCIIGGGPAGKIKIKFLLIDSDWNKILPFIIISNHDLIYATFKNGILRKIFL